MMREFIICVDVGGTSIKLGKFTKQGELVEKWSIRTNKSNHGESILPDIVQSIRENVDLSTVRGIGLGVPGPVKENVVIHCVNLGWGLKNLDE